MAALQATRPGFTASDLTRNLRWITTDPIWHYREGLIKAGLPG